MMEQGRHGNHPAGYAPAMAELRVHHRREALSWPDLLGALAHRMVYLYATMMTATIASLGAALWMHSFQLSSIRPGLAEDSFQAFKTTVLMLLGNLGMPFFESAASLVSAEMFEPSNLAESLTAGVWNFWMPMLFGCLLLSYGGLGFSCTRVRSARASILVPFGLVAVIMLVWQVEMHLALARVAEEEVLTLEPKQTHLNTDQMPHYNLFKLSYDKFRDVLRDYRCRIDRVNKGTSLMAECQDDSVEAHLVQVVITQVCEAGVADAEDAKVVQVCLTQGQQLGIMSGDLPNQDEAYCRCRRLVFETLQHVTAWSMVAWFGQFFGVCATIYFGVEPNLRKMPANQRRDVRVYGVVMMAVVAVRVMMYEGMLSHEPADS